MKLSFEQLQAFLTTVETGSFSAAARKLGKAQSSISGLISNLEIDAGFEVFDRSKRTPPLTAEGLALLNDIKSVLKSYNNLPDHGFHHITVNHGAGEYVRLTDREIRAMTGIHPTVTELLPYAIAAWLDSLLGERQLAWLRRWIGERATARLDRAIDRERREAAGELCADECKPLRHGPLAEAIVAAVTVPLVYGHKSGHDRFFDAVYAGGYTQALKQTSQSGCPTLVSTPWRSGAKGPVYFINCFPQGNQKVEMFKDFGRLVLNLPNRGWGDDIYAAFES